MAVQYKATGRRKKSVARVILTTGTGKFIINGREFEEYIPNPATRLDVLQPLELTENVGRFDIKVNVFGRDYWSAGAIRHRNYSCIIRSKPDLRKILKPAGLITRDSRTKERKKYGLKKVVKQVSFQNVNLRICLKEML